MVERAPKGGDKINYLVARPVKKKAAPIPAMKGKKGKKGKKGGDVFDEAQFERDLARAIEESKREAGLLEPLPDYNAGPAGVDAEVQARNEEERKEMEERMEAQAE